MKEAAGEANLTIITIILIGVIVAIATPLINTMMTTAAKRSCCQNVGGKLEGNTCKDANTGAVINNWWSNNKCVTS